MNEYISNAKSGIQTPNYSQRFFENIGDMLGYGTTAKQMQFNADQAQLQRDWEEYMSNTSYQRAVKDMQEAGLNPALALGQGGASTPTATSAHSNGTRATFANNLNSASNLIKTISGIAKNDNDKKNDNLTHIVSTALKVAKMLG